MKTPIPYARARRYAEQIATALQPFCNRLEIAGSIRRERPYCGDIDIVAEPKDEPALRARIVNGEGERPRELVQNGPQNIHVRLANGIELQVFLARPESKDMFETKPSNWGSLLLCRTGSKEHNIFIAQTARANYCEWKIYEGLFKVGPDAPRGPSQWIAGASEEEIFAALHLAFVPPPKREMGQPGHHVPIAPFGSSHLRP